MPFGIALIGLPFNSFAVVAEPSAVALLVMLLNVFFVVGYAFAILVLDA